MIKYYYRLRYAVIFLFSIFIIGFGLNTKVIAKNNANSKQQSKILLGIDVLERLRFKPLIGKRVGLLTHPAGVNGKGISTVEILKKSRKVNLVALFGPEHGIYGDEKANEPVDNRIDNKTRLPVYSLYGKYRRPTAKMLSKIDVLVIDLQDIGVRSYTYVSAMLYAMEECFKHNVEVVVLDRPNPLGGLKVDGPNLDKQWMSYVGSFRVPYVHGLTIGELAKMAKNVPGRMNLDIRTQKKGKLTIVPMKYWKRDMMWPDTGLKWIPTSPAIPNVSAAMGYAMTGLGAQVGGFKHGYGTRFPFRLLSFPDVSPSDLKNILVNKNIPGLDYKLIKIKNKNGRYDRGVFVKVEDWNALNPTELSIYMMQLSCTLNQQNPFATLSENKARLFNKHVGSTQWWNEISRYGKNVNVKKFIDIWKQKSKVFKSISRKYHIYK